jgi:RHS repeat-associated protein
MRHRALTLNRTIRTFTFLAVIALSPQLFASSKPIAAGEARYVIVLAPGARTPDIAALGGRVEASTWQSLTIVIPISAEPALRASSAIRSITPVVTGSSERVPSETAPTRNSHPRSDHARDASMSTTIWGSGQYAYDGVGNITAMGIAAVLPNSDGKVCTFTYDLASRLTNATMGRAAGDRVESYTYDGFGNLTQRTLNSTPGSYNPAPDPTNNQMTETGTHYDEAGNLDNWATMASFTYDAVNQVTSLTPNLPGTPPSFYVYDVNDERVAVQSGSATQWTIRDLNNKPIRQFTSGLLTDSAWSGAAWLWAEDFVWNGNTLVAGDRPPATGGPRNFHVDHLGSIRAVTDGTGLVVSSEDYAPLGEELLTTGISEGPLKFTGHERDGNFDYMHARYYDWRRGRFLSVDPSLDQKKTLPNPQMWNRYSYVINNPIRNTDPDGREHVQEPGFTKPLSEANDWAQHPEVAWAFYAEGFSLSLAADEFVIGPAVGKVVGAVGRVVGRFFGKSEEVVEAGAKLSRYDDVTTGRSIPNRATNVSRAEFGKNLEAKGFAKTVSKDGKVTIFEKGGVKYTVRETAKSTGGPTAEVFKDGKLLGKIRLEAPK